MPAPDLISHAARFFVFAEQTSHLPEYLNEHFWVLSASFVAETATYLPALAAAVKTVDPHDLWPGILTRVAHQPLPVVLSPEAVRWHHHLVTAWESHRASKYLSRQNLARLALVRLDGCGMPDGQKRPSRLPEWLAEAQTIVGAGSGTAPTGEWEGRPEGRTYRRYDWEAYKELEALAALAAWRPAPRVITPPETLREWVDLWMEMGQSNDPVEKGLAAIALLNLPEAALRAASIPPAPTVQLLRQVTTAIRIAAERIDQNYLSLLDWQPVKGTTWPVEEMRNVVQAWLDIGRHKEWTHRCAAWRQLIRWDRAGSLDICGMDLLPDLVKAVPTEKNGDVLWELAQWIPNAERFTVTGTPGSLSQLRQLEEAWEQHRISGYLWQRTSGWLARIRLQQAGLASEPPESFLQAYLSTVADECSNYVLFALAHWFPGTDAAGRWCRDWYKSWQQRLLDEDRCIGQITACALLRQSMEKGHGRSLRCATLGLWRTGMKASSDVMDTIDAVLARVHEVRAYLAAGEVPDFEGKLPSPTERCRPPLALPPGRIAGSEWQMENEKWKMENGEWRMKHQAVTVKPNPRLVPDSASR